MRTLPLNARHARRLAARVAGLFIAVAALVAAPVHAAPSLEVQQMLERVQTQLNRSDFRAVLDDPRYASNKTEAARLSIVCQLLGYAELNSVHPSPGYKKQIYARARYLADNLQTVKSGTAFDGMLALAFMKAYIVTGDPVFWNNAGLLIPKLLELDGFRATLNWGLMMAMAFTQYYELSGDESAHAKALEIIESLQGYQQLDGSFPHYCPGSKDIHYTAFMGLELVIIERMMPSDGAEDVLQKISDFLATRVNANGETRYVDPCPSRPLCARYYYGLATGCRQDYDTRGWVNEPGYSAAVFDQQGEPKFWPVLTFLSGLERDGGFPDKWGYLPPKSDPQYSWATADPSVIRTSVNFWSLATIAAGSQERRPAMRSGLPRMRPFAREHGLDIDAMARAALAAGEWSAGDRMAILGIEPGTGSPLGVTATCTCEEVKPDTVPSHPVSSMKLGPVIPNPGVPPMSVHLSLTTPMPVEAGVFDLNGRRLRTLLSSTQPAGERDVAWDGHDDAGRVLGKGLYFLRVQSGGTLIWRKLLVL